MKLTSSVKGSIFIQPHDFPDPDAVASSFAFARLLASYGVQSELLYYGFIQRQALNKMISKLEIPLRHESSYLVAPEDVVILIDGNRGNRNVTSSDGKLIAVIDHHLTSKPPEDVLSDIRPQYGACASIIAEYWKESGKKPDSKTATALSIGLARDTDNFKRMIDNADLAAFSYLWEFTDHNLYYDIVRNNIEIDDRLYYRQLMNTVILEDHLGHMIFPSGCPLGMMGILGDFLLSMNDIHFSFLGAVNGSDLNLSIRSEMKEVNAAEILQELLKGIGWGGGHEEMAGGIVPNGSQEVFNTLLQKLKINLLGKQF